MTTTKSRKGMSDSLARLDAGQAQLQQEPIDVRELVAQSWQRCESQAAARGLTLHSEVAEDFRPVSDRTAMSMVLSNLLENATQYADERGDIWVTARHVDGLAEVAVVNTGCTLTHEQVPRVFDRFWRSDASREKPVCMSASASPWFAELPSRWAERRRQR